MTAYDYLEWRMNIDFHCFDGILPLGVSATGAIAQFFAAGAPGSLASLLLLAGWSLRRWRRGFELHAVRLRNGMSLQGHAPPLQGYGRRALPESPERRPRKNAHSHLSN